MCKQGIAVSYLGQSGRASNIRPSKKRNLIICDFTEKTSQTPVVANVSELKFLNKKAEKKMKEILNSLKEKKTA